MTCGVDFEYFDHLMKLSWLVTIDEAIVVGEQPPIDEAIVVGDAPGSQATHANCK